MRHAPNPVPTRRCCVQGESCQVGPPCFRAGKPVLHVASNGRRLHTFAAILAAEEELTLAFEALHRVPRRRTLIVEEVDGNPIHESPHAETLRRCGFGNDYRGLAAEIGCSIRA